ncbi:MAG: hypothetical protein ACU836_14920 [Gammaproteobacteria bacterium]
MSNNIHKFMSVSDRLAWLKGKRPVAVWERETGIARGNLDRALKDGKLSEENIRKLCRVENMRSDWLLIGRGTPFYVAEFVSDQAFADALLNYFADEGQRWTLTVIRRKSNGMPCVVALTMPTSNQTANDRQPSAQMTVELLSGPIGVETSKVVCRPDWGRVQGLGLDDDIVRRMQCGEVGTYELLFSPGYLLQASDLDSKVLAAISEGVAVGEQKNGYVIPLTPDERSMLNRYRALSGDDKARLAAISDALANLDKG